MAGNVANQRANQVAELAVLLQHIACGADGTHGSQLWDSLAQVINGANPGPVGDTPGMAELTALRQAPDDNNRAEALALVLVHRAGTDPGFGKRFSAWRRRKNVRTLMASIRQTQQQTPAQPSSTTLPANSPDGTTTAPVPGTPVPGTPVAASADPTATGWKMSEVLQTTVAIAGLAAALLALRWPLFEVASILTLMIAGTALWYHRRRGQSWRAKPVAATGGACVLALAVLVTAFSWRPGPSSDKPRPQAYGSSSHNATTSGTNGPELSPGSALAGTSADSPARVESVTPLNTITDGTRAVANGVQLTAGQLGEFNADNLRSGFDSTTALRFWSSIHAIPVGDAYTNVTVIGNAKTTVTITGINVVKDCRAPLTGSLFINGSQGVNGTIGLGFDLDSPIDYARTVNYGYHGDFFKSHVVTLAPGEAQTFDIQVQTLTHYCQFAFQMTVATPGGSVTESITNNGKPFELTGTETVSGRILPYSKYSDVYIGGIDATLIPSLHDRTGDFVQVNPKTFRM